MITRTFLSKCNTIVKDSKDNFGLYPVCMLNHGETTSRALVYFDISDMVTTINNGEYGVIYTSARTEWREIDYTDVLDISANTVYHNFEILSVDNVVIDDSSLSSGETTSDIETTLQHIREKTRHYLKMYNCGSIDTKRFHCPIPSNDNKGYKKRATGFDIIALKVPKHWDRGIGFDDSRDFWFIGDASVSQEGSNWYYCKAGVEWPSEGIFTDEEIAAEYEKYESGLDSLIVAKQHFDYGNEDLNLDITDYINNLIDRNEANKGLCLAFAPMDETSDTDTTQYVGFFSDKTNTFYQPVLETHYDDVISDDRNKFYLNKYNRLYLYSNINGKLTNLDELPKCTVDGIEYEVTHQTVGVYYVEVCLKSSEYEKDMILEDVWSNLKYDTETLDDVTMEFTTLGQESYFKIGKNASEPRKTSVVLNGIGHGEKLNRGEIREVSVDFRIPYTHKRDFIDGKVFYRIYVMDGNKEIDVIDWDGVNMCCDYSYFIVDTNGLLPQEYRVDIMVYKGKTPTTFKNELSFKIVNNFTKKRL